MFPGGRKLSIVVRYFLFTIAYFIVKIVILKNFRLTFDFRIYHEIF